ncbi:MAG: NAD(P)-dependent alcohol dehydrogenase [Ignavibacteria bacterium]|nr:NAD(P)-dependent alcohol dehydrogenase [Ignavibacteria bacterium]MBK7576764.1 NAD(P)-dependent alcohol dehydrogenase [Ignavibacteria bacterium]
MKAAIHLRYGPPEVVSISDVPSPTLQDGEFLVRVHASTVNRTDCGFRSAVYVISRLFSGLFKPRRNILGCEYAGEVTDVQGVKTVKPGDRVFGYNDTRFGGHAEYMVVNANDAFALIPESMSFIDAAPLTEGSHYALCDLRAAHVGEGTSVLIYGATGAIGSAAVQLARVMGAKVTAVCGAAHLDLVRSLGADRVIDFTSSEFARLRETFDVVFDAVGKLSWSRCKPLLTDRGCYISTELGPRYENPFLALLTPLLGGKRVLFPIPTITARDVEYLRSLAIKGSYRPLIDRVMSLDEIVDAYRYVETGQKIGNVVISV